jgi:Ca2+-binding EF-hand superfamily protein
MKHYHFHPELWLDRAAESQNLVESVASVELSEQQLAQIKEIFELFDTDGGGSIDCREKDAALYALGFKPSFGSKHHAPKRNSSESVQASNDSCSAFGEDNISQTISLHEFTQLMKGEQMVRNPLDAIWGAFAELSGDPESRLANGPGLVTLEGLQKACSKYDVKLTHDELIQMIADTDIDGSGAVDKEEFLHIMNQTPWF